MAATRPVWPGHSLEGTRLSVAGRISGGCNLPRRVCGMRAEWKKHTETQQVVVGTRCRWLVVRGWVGWLVYRGLVGVFSCYCCRSGCSWRWLLLIGRDVDWWLKREGLVVPGCGGRIQSTARRSSSISSSCWSLVGRAR